ncbi:MAG: UDP-N-acetylmuramoyl-tripeptide--D-alanyl-D-alanine ligase, partial [Clostridia bacterium]|nr:UDP-N-acetylmuramoyl-tripeptide--D-alanyl-D-alanine ligase [Clostridia bacterium]
MLLVLAVVAFVFLGDNTVFAAGAVGFFMLCNGISYRRPKAKKPLVYTSRVKRLLVTQMLIAAALMTAGWFVRIDTSRLAPLMLGLVGCLSAVWVLVSNLLNWPIDKGLYTFYFERARKKLAKHNVTVIGVTGSYGKTSTKFILGKLLSVGFNTLITPESYNTPMGLCKVINGSLSPTHQIFVAEMGAGCVGDIKELCRLCNPTHGVISSIGPQHLKTMKTLENIISTKFELADHVAKRGGTMFLNFDNEYIANHPTDAACVRYGITAPDVDYRAEDIKADTTGCSFTICEHSGKRTPVRTRLLGRHNVINILSAVAVCNKFGLPTEQLVGAIRQPNGLTIIDDAYNSNPSGAAAALETLSWFDTMKIVVTPGMVELGAVENEKNYELGKQAAAVADLLILVGGKRTDPIRQGALDAGYDPKKLLCVEKFTDAAAVFSQYANRSAVVLLENDLPDNY